MNNDWKMDHSFKYIIRTEGFVALILRVVWFYVKTPTWYSDRHREIKDKHVSIIVFEKIFLLVFVLQTLLSLF